MLLLEFHSNNMNSSPLWGNRYLTTEASFLITPANSLRDLCFKEDALGKINLYQYGEKTLVVQFTPLSLNCPQSATETYWQVIAEISVRPREEDASVRTRQGESGEQSKLKRLGKLAPVPCQRSYPTFYKHYLHSFLGELALPGWRMEMVSQGR